MMIRIYVEILVRNRRQSTYGKALLQPLQLLAPRILNTRGQINLVFIALKYKQYR